MRANVVYCRRARYCSCWMTLRTIRLSLARARARLTPGETIEHQVQTLALAAHRVGHRPFNPLFVAPRLEVQQQHDPQDHGTGHQRQTDPRFERVYDIRGEPQLALKQHQDGHHHANREQSRPNCVATHRGRRRPAGQRPAAREHSRRTREKAHLLLADLGSTLSPVSVIES